MTIVDVSFFSRKSHLSLSMFVDTRTSSIRICRQMTAIQQYNWMIY